MSPLFAVELLTGTSIANKRCTWEDVGYEQHGHCSKAWCLRDTASVSPPAVFQICLACVWTGKL